MCFILCLELWGATDELSELWRVERPLMENVYAQLVKLRGINWGHEVFQIFADPFERQQSENREESAYRRRWTSGFPVRAAQRGFEFNCETFEPGQYGETGEYRFG